MIRAALLGAFLFVSAAESESSPAREPPPEPMPAAALAVSAITAITVVWLATRKPRSGWDR